MSQWVVLKLGSGDWQQGFPSVIVQLWQSDRSISTQLTGQLPPNLELAALYTRWRSLYAALSHRLPIRQHFNKTISETKSRIGDRTNREIINERIIEKNIEIDIEPEGVTNISRAVFNDLSQQLQQQLNHWLESDSFAKVERRLRTHLLPSQQIHLIIETDQLQLRQFPWHLWSFFDDYPQAEVGLSTPNYQQIGLPPTRSSKLRILAVLGNSAGIDLQHDRALLEQLPAADTVFLVEPQRAELDRWLWDEQGWDILFFAGHSTSQTDRTTGTIALNPTDYLTVEQLKHALRAAITRGLQLAIFNSCDGLGLAWAIAELNIPQVIVMREPVPDRVAQIFLKHLLTACSGGKSLYQAVREAREKLQGLEDQFPCASWLPVLCHNPATPLLLWQTPQTALMPSAQRFCFLSRSKSLGMAGFISLVVTIGLMGLRASGLLQAWELTAYDHLLRSRPAETADPRLVVVEITQEDSERYGYPLTDDTIATLLEKLQPLQPQAIGVDLHRAKPRGTGRDRLMAQFQQHPNLFLVCGFGAADSNYGTPPEFSPAQAVQQVGFSDLLLDGEVSATDPSRTDLVNAKQATHLDDVVRRQLLSYAPALATVPSPCTTPYSLSLKLAFRFLEENGIQPLQVNEQGNWQFGAVALSRLPVRFGGYQNLDGLSSQILINYRTAPPGQRLTLSQVLSGQINPTSVQDRIVLIGTTSPIVRDSLQTPYGEMPGVWIHAHMVSQILSAVINNRPLIWVLPQWGAVQWGDALWIFVWAAVGTGLTRVLHKRWLWALAQGGATLALYQLCLLVLTQGGWMPFVPSVLALWLTGGGLVSLNTLQERRPS